MENVRTRCGLLALGVLATTVGPVVSVSAEPAKGTTLSPSRMVHHFDFDERAEGNLEDIPKYWEPLHPTGFPHYAQAAFDFSVGRLAPPSFHVAGEGRNAAYGYTGPETRVRRNSDYRLTAFVRGDRLTHARACLSAHFVDKFGQPITETLVRSRYVGGAADGDEWVPVELYLAAAPREAQTIGLIAWVLQKPKWSTAAPSRREIPRNDVRGGAWFDDISVYALPHVQMTTGAPGNILTPDAPHELRITLADNESPSLRGRLSITAADGGLVETQPVSVVREAGVEPIRISVGHLSPGLYHARLQVFGEAEMPIVTRDLTFARLGRLGESSRTTAKSFGVVVDPQHRSDPAAELILLRHQIVRSAKLPVRPGLGNARPTVRERRATDRLLQELVKSGFALTGVFVGPSSVVAGSAGADPQALFELLAGDPAAWREHLAAVVAPYASLFHSWQVGADPRPTDRVDGAGNERLDDQRALALTQLREAMVPFITMPHLGVSVPTEAEPEAQKFPAEQVTLALRNTMPPEWFAARIDGMRSLGYQHVSVYLEPLPSDRYNRRSRLADWAQRIVTARHVGADTVFVPQTWQVRETPQGRITEPNETYILLRTLAGLLGDAEPGPRVRVSDGVHALAFDRGDSMVLVMWDPSAPSEGRDYALQLGRADRQFDLWGRPSPLSRNAEGRHIVHLTPSPVLVPGIEPWLIGFRAALNLTPSHVESGRELVRHQVQMAYRGDRTLSGSMVLTGPDSWQITPRTFTFNLSPQRTENRAVQIRYPHTEPAGKKTITAKITLADESYYLEVPLVVELSVADLAVWGLAVVERDEVVLRQVVANHSDDILSFRGSAAVPGRERQYRPISRLHPGETQSVEYRFGDGSALIGREARLVLREVNDGPRVHSLELTIP